MSPEPILFLTYWYPNKNKKSFGIFIKRHAQAIALRRPLVLLSVNIIQSKKIFSVGSEMFFDERGLETHRIHIETRFYKMFYTLVPLHLIIIRRYLNKKLNRKFSAIHSNVLFPCALAGNSLSKTYKLPHLITEHWTKVDKFFASNPFRKSGRKALDSAAMITGVSKQLQSTIKKYTGNPNIKVIPNIIEGDLFRYDPAVVKNKVFTFIAVSFWDNYKNPFLFLDALENIHRKDPGFEFQLSLIGSGPQVEQIRKRNYSFNLRFLGACEPPEIAREMKQSHVFLHGSDYETFSVVIVEALLCGLPSVVSPVGVAPEVIHSGNGFISANDVSEWESKIRLVVNGNYDCRKISDELTELFTRERIGERFAEAYRAINV